MYNRDDSFAHYVTYQILYDKCNSKARCSFLPFYDSQPFEIGKDF